MVYRFNIGGATLVAFCCMSGLAGSAFGDARGMAGTSAVRITRTADGLPHVHAKDWRGAGMGLGYAQAQDALCTLADAFVTFEGKRAYFFGADAKPAYKATFTGANNLELDIFFRAFLDSESIAQVRAQQPAQLNDLLDGYADGYNRYLAEPGTRRGANARCAKAAWVRPITGDDLLRRMRAAVFAAGYARFIPEIVNARPPVPGAAARPPAAASAYQPWSVGQHAHLGSNAIGFGGEAAQGGSVLFGNPHWYWGGPDRLYQAHVTIPGQLDVAGAGFLGVPLTMVGFNQNVAWTHTVSTARRFGLFALQLDPADPLRYQVDGVGEAMQARDITVPIRTAAGRDDSVTRTLYRTRFGPVIDLGPKAPQFGWTGTTAVAIRDVNDDNHRVWRTYLDMNRAGSLEELVNIQQRELSMPWVNTIAIGRGDARAWFADVGTVPGVPDTLKEACRTPLGAIFATLDASVPFLDGARAGCDWQTDSSTIQRGTMPVAGLPALFRADYVANMNDSYWLSNPKQPLEGYAALLGGERTPLALRGRNGHALAERLLANERRDAGDLASGLMREVLSSEDYAATLFKPALLAAACAQPQVALAPDAKDASAPQAPVTVDVGRACEVLQAWQGKAGVNDRGALLWDAFWSRVQRVPAKELYAQPFDPAHPLDTPAAPRLAGQGAAEALASIVRDFARQGRALDAPVGQYLHARSGGARIALYGGCGGGYFTVTCPGDGPASGLMDGGAHANTYLQIVRFVPGGVQAHTLLANGETDVAFDGTRIDPGLSRYARQQWLRFPFSEQEVARERRLMQNLSPR